MDKVTKCLVKDKMPRETKCLKDGQKVKIYDKLTRESKYNIYFST